MATPRLDKQSVRPIDFEKLNGKVKRALEENLAPDETISIIIRGADGQAMIGTESRVFVCKPGFMAGATFGVENTSWSYLNLLGVQLHKGLMSARQERLQAPYADLRTGHPARALAERRQPQRHPRVVAARGCDPARARQARPPPPPAAAAARRPCLPLPRQPPRTPQAANPGKVARPKSPHGSGLGRERWVVERTIAWLHQYRRLRVRYERRADIHEAFLQIAGCLICLKLLTAEESFC